MKFELDLGVYVCPHIYNNQRPILDVVRDEDGEFQFLCGSDKCIEESEPRHVCIKHLLNRDSSLNELKELKPGTFAERESQNSSWVYGKLE